jgi:hypothetical protein
MQLRDKLETVKYYTVLTSVHSNINEYYLDYVTHMLRKNKLPKSITNLRSRVMSAIQEVNYNETDDMFIFKVTSISRYFTAIKVYQWVKEMLLTLPKTHSVNKYNCLLRNLLLHVQLTHL